MDAVGLAVLARGDDEVQIRIDAGAEVQRTLAPFVASVEAETRSKIVFAVVAPSVESVDVDLGSGPARIGLIGKAVAP